MPFDLHQVYFFVVRVVEDIAPFISKCSPTTASIRMGEGSDSVQRVCSVEVGNLDSMNIFYVLTTGVRTMPCDISAMFFSFFSGKIRLQKSSSSTECGSLTSACGQITLFHSHLKCFLLKVQHSGTDEPYLRRAYRAPPPIPLLSAGPLNSFSVLRSTFAFAFLPHSLLNPHNKPNVTDGTGTTTSAGTDRVTLADDISVHPHVVTVSSGSSPLSFPPTAVAVVYGGTRERR